MNIEIVNELKKFIQEGNEKLADIKAEYEELTSLSHEQTDEDINRIKEIRQTVAPLAERIKNAESDLATYEDLAKEVDYLNERLKNAKTEDSIRIATRLRDSKVKEFETFEEILKTSYADILRDVIVATEPEVENLEVEAIEENPEKDDNDKKTKRNQAIGGVSVLAVIAAILIFVSVNSKKNNKQKTTTNDEPTKAMDTINTPLPTSTPELTLVEEKLGGFRDINDLDAVRERASEIVADITKNNPDYVISNSDIENMILWFNGGVVENATKEDRDRMLDLYLDLLGRDAYEAKEQFDFTKLFLEGTRAEKAAQESYEVRKEILATMGTDKVNESADKLAELFAKSMNGLDGAQSFNTIENKMAQAAILLANVYNYATADFDRAAIYTDENGFVYDLNEMMAAVNTECIYDEPLNDATEERKTVDLLTSLLDGALLDARDLKEAKGLSLTK